jgi:hypothetical protein
MKSLLLGFAVLTTACVAKDDGLSNDETTSAGDALGTGIEDSAKGYGPLAEGAGVDAPCATLSGNTADTDQDNIPSDATVTFNCTSMASGFTGMLTGTINVTDDAPYAAAWAFTGEANMNASLTGPLGGSIVRDWHGTLVGTQTTNFATHRTLDVTTVFTNARNQSVTVTEDVDWNVTYTPTVTWTPGSIAVTGKLTATGEWNVTIGAHAANATIETPTPLTLDPNCATRVTAGTVTGTYDHDGVARTITVTWTACGTHTVAST